MSIKTIDSEIVKVTAIGNAVAAAEKYTEITAQAMKHEAIARGLRKEAKAYADEAKKQEITLSELQDDEKKALVIAGVKTPKDFPGDDWLVDYVVGEK